MPRQQRPTHYVGGSIDLTGIKAWKGPVTNVPLGCYPFQDKDQFVIEECPHVYFVGNQPQYDTTVIDGPAGQQVRLIAIPRFHSTGEMVLLDTETLEVEVVKFDVHDEVC